MSRGRRLIHRKREMMKHSITLATLFVLTVILCISFACNRSAETRVSNPNGPGATTSPIAKDADVAIAELTQRLKTLKEGVGDEAGLAVVHVETGRTVEIEGARKLPLFSVFKLPLAITVLGEVEAKRLQLDKQVRVTPQDVATGSQFNADLWRQPVDKTVAELIEISIVLSDNTSTDKLLELIGGPQAVTEKMRSLGFKDIDVISTTRFYAAHRDKPNTGSAMDLAGLLVKLQKGELLQPSNTELLLGFMKGAKTGQRRLRGKLPAGTEVGDKTGTGETTTNDIGIITLPEGRGHLAIAILMSSLKLKMEAQEDIIADMTRAAYDAFVSIPPGKL